MAVLASSAEMMAQNFLAGLSFLPNLNKQSGDQSRDHRQLDTGLGEKQEKRRRGEWKTSSRGNQGKNSLKFGERTSPQWCDVCKITLNAPNQLEQHYAGVKKLHNC